MGRRVHGDFSSVEDHQSYSFNMKACILVLAMAVAAQAQFEPAKCDWEKEQVCPGMWDSETGKQTSPDTCMPMKNGDCMNHCPMNCGKDMMLCPGKMDSNGCKMPDMCMPNKVGDCWNSCPMDCGKDTVCPGAMDPKGCMMPATCMPVGMECPKM